MRMLHLIAATGLAVLAVACTGSVIGSSLLSGDTGADGDVADADDEPEPLVAQIVGDTHVADASNDVSLDAVPSTTADASYSWDFGDGTTATGASVTHTYAAPGCYVTTLTVSAPTAKSGSTTTNVYVPAAIDITIDLLPVDHGFAARVPGESTATVAITGTAQSPGWQAIAVDVIADSVVQRTFTTPLCSQTAEAFNVATEIPVALQSYTLAVRAIVGDQSEDLAQAQDLVAGDVIIIQGQSNAVAADTAGATLATSPFVRSWGSATTDEATSVADNAWHTATGNGSSAAGTIGQWGMKMALDLIDRHQVPLAVFNGAHGGKPIAWFQRNDANHADTSTNYGRLLRRLRATKLDTEVRTVMYFQGESDGSNAEGHRDGFAALYDDWRDDFPTIEHLYVTQVRPGCGSPSLELRDYQRQFATTLPNTSTMSTSAMDQHDGCHYKYTGGYELLGQQYARLLSRDLFGSTGESDLEAIDVLSASYDAANSRIVVLTSSDASALTVEADMASKFTVVGSTRTVSNVTVQDKNIILSLTAGTDTPTEVRYEGHQGVGPTVLNARGVGLLVFRLAL